MAKSATEDCGPDRTPLQNSKLEHRPASVESLAKFVNAPRPKGDRDMDDRPF